MIVVILVYQSRSKGELNMLYDENLTLAEIRLIETLKGKSRMEQDQIIYEYERGDKK